MPAHAFNKDRITKNAVVDEAGCWNWSRRVDRYGYGQITARPNRRPQVMGAHRYSFIAHIGPVPAGSMVLHSCDNPRCVNPSHLRLGSHTENMADKVKRDRCSRGTSQPASKLTDEDVRSIRKIRESGATVASLAARFGVAESLVVRIYQRKAWAHVPEENAE